MPNGIIIIDKPAGWTSQDVCSKMRGALREKRVGHSGTLDPMATGVLTVFVGRATRAAQFAESAVKRYAASMKLGIVTDTQDTTGAVLETRETNVSREELLAVLPEFTGEISQIPPMYSAVKVGGRKLYELARRGQSVERKARSVTIHKLALLGGEADTWSLDITCSKGTYIRTLIHDMGERLGCGAAMESLRRLEAGPYTLADAYTLEEIIAAAENGSADTLLRPVDTMFSQFPALTVTGERERRCRNGNPFNIRGVDDGQYRVYAESGEFLMLGEAESGVMRTVKSFF